MILYKQVLCCVFCWLFAFGLSLPKEEEDQLFLLNEFLRALNNEESLADDNVYRGSTTSETESTVNQLASTFDNEFLNSNVKGSTDTISVLTNSDTNTPSSTSSAELITTSKILLETNEINQRLSADEKPLTLHYEQGNCLITSSNHLYESTVSGFYCNGICLPYNDSWRCDGLEDCEDGIDERDCPAETVLTTTASQEIETTSETVLEMSEINQTTSEDNASRDEQDYSAVPTTTASVEVQTTTETGDINQTTPGDEETLTTESSVTSEMAEEEPSTINQMLSKLYPLEKSRQLVKTRYEVIDVTQMLPLPITLNVHIDNMNNYFGNSNTKAEEKPRIEEVQPTEKPRIEEVQPTEKPRIEEVQPTEKPRIEEVQPTEKPQIKEKKKRFEVEFTRKNWMEANALCKSKGGNLASIMSEVENTQAVTKLQSSHVSDGKLNQVWIGGFCPDKDQECYWSDSWNRFTYKNWRTGEPNHLYYDKKDEMCAQFNLRLQWQWNDDLCAKQFACLCEYYD